MMILYHRSSQNQTSFFFHCHQSPKHFSSPFVFCLNQLCNRRQTSKSVMDLWFSEVAQAFQLWKLVDAQANFLYAMNFWSWNSKIVRFLIFGAEVACVPAALARGCSNTLMMMGIRKHWHYQQLRDPLLS